MKRLLLVAFLLFTFMQTQAQIKFHVGISTALNNTFVLDKGLKEDPRYFSTATYNWAPIGVSFGINFGRRFGLSLESIKAVQGQYYQVRDAYDQIVGFRNFEMSYLEIPLLLKLMSGGDGLARFNFQLGPQLAIIQQGKEVLNYAQSVQNIPDNVVAPDGAVELPDGTYEVPAYDEVISSTPDIANVFGDFQEQEIQIAGAMGVELDILRNFYLGVNVKANYSFTDMRGQQLLDLVSSDNYSEIFEQRANLAVGLQLSLHWMIGGTRHFNAKDKKLRDAMKSE